MPVAPTPIPTPIPLVSTASCVSTSPQVLYTASNCLNWVSPRDQEDHIGSVCVSAGSFALRASPAAGVLVREKKKNPERTVFEGIQNRRRTGVWIFRKTHRRRWKRAHTQICTRSRSRVRTPARLHALMYTKGEMRGQSGTHTDTQIQT